MNLPLAAWIFVGMGGIAFGLDAFALQRVFRSSFYDQRQRWAQAALILFVPILGAYLAICLARESVPLFQPQPVDRLDEHIPDGWM